MRSVNLAFLAGIVLFCSAAMQGAVVDFDNLPGGGTIAANTVLTTQYSSIGVTFSAIEDGSPVSAAVINTFSPISGNYWANTPDGNYGPRWDALIMDFSTPVSGVSWLTQSHGSLSITFNAYDAGNNLLETLVITGDWAPSGFAASGISRIEALQPDDGWGWGMDNLEFSSGQVPEPATYGMFALGLAAATLLGRKRRRQLRGWIPVAEVRV
jgi:hypothetical protein